MSNPDEGDIRVVRGTVHPFDAYPVPGLIVQHAVPNADKDGWLLVTNHWEDLCPLCDYVDLYGGEGLTGQQYALSRRLRAIVDSGQPLPPH